MNAQLIQLTPRRRALVFGKFEFPGLNRQWIPFVETFFTLPIGNVVPYTCIKEAMDITNPATASEYLRMMNRLRRRVMRFSHALEPHGYALSVQPCRGYVVRTLVPPLIARAA